MNLKILQKVKLKKHKVVVVWTCPNCTNVEKLESLKFKKITSLRCPICKTAWCTWQIEYDGKIL